MWRKESFEWARIYSSLLEHTTTPVRLSMIYITALRIESMAWSSEIVWALANIHIAKYFSQLFEAMLIYLICI